MPYYKFKRSFPLLFYWNWNVLFSIHYLLMTIFINNIDNNFQLKRRIISNPQHFHMKLFCIRHSFQFAAQILKISIENNTSFLNLALNNFSENEYKWINIVNQTSIHTKCHAMMKFVTWVKFVMNQIQTNNFCVDISINHFFFKF